MSLYFATIAAALLRFWQLGARPFDGDEGVILWQASQPSVTQFFEAVGRDAHPPLMAALSWLGTRLFGVSEVGMRFFPAVAGTLLVPASYLLAKELLGRKQALLVAWLVALSPFLLSFSQEARMYAPLTLFTTLALWALVKEKPWHFALLAAAAMYSHYLGLLLVPLALFKKFWRGLAGAVILILPLVPLAMPQFIGRIQEAGGTNVAANIKGFVNAFYRFGAGRSFLGLEFSPQAHLNWLREKPLSWIAFIVTLAVPALLLLYGVWRSRRDKQLLPVATFVGMTILLALVSSEVGSRAARNLSFLAPLYLIFLTTGIFSMKRPAKYAAAAVVFAIFLVGVWNHHFKEVKQPGVPAIVRYIHDQHSENAAVLTRGAFLEGESTVFKHYWRRFYDNPPPNVVDYYGNYRIGNISELRKQSVQALANQLLKDHPTVFFYDFSYRSHDVGAEPVILGYDKENQPLALWRVSR